MERARRMDAIFWGSAGEGGGITPWVVGRFVGG